MFVVKFKKLIQIQGWNNKIYILLFCSFLCVLFFVIYIHNYYINQIIYIYIQYIYINIDIFIKHIIYMYIYYYVFIITYTEQQRKYKS